MSRPAYQHNRLPSTGGARQAWNAPNVKQKYLYSRATDPGREGLHSLLSYAFEPCFRSEAREHILCSLTLYNKISSLSTSTWPTETCHSLQKSWKKTKKLWKDRNTLYTSLPDIHIARTSITTVKANNTARLNGTLLTS